MVICSKRLGIGAVRVIKGQYKNVRLNKEFRSDYQISGLGELMEKNILKD